MRDLIKILIALAFIAGAFWIGKYMAADKCSNQLKEVNSKIESDTKLILQLHDSISILKMELKNEKIKIKIDSVKAKSQVKMKNK